jgi:hypothetical protein
VEREESEGFRGMEISIPTTESERTDRKRATQERESKETHEQAGEEMRGGGKQEKSQGQGGERTTCFASFDGLLALLADHLVDSLLQRDNFLLLLPLVNLPKEREEGKKGRTKSMRTKAKEDENARREREREP